ncbi:MAG: DUF4241 domain-containing protein, partial [Pseudanabaena sp. RU_4_16]|nr:DUF4241 domain-containing protein [Pseudanabaena sp. RU_4_16]
NPDPVAYKAARKIGSEQAWNLTMAASDRFKLEFCDQAIAQMEKNQFGKHPLIASWADIQISKKILVNVITFSSGWGDGGYASYWGYDATEKITSLVTDFGLFSDDSSED